MQNLCVQKSYMHIEIAVNFTMCECLLTSQQTVVKLFLWTSPDLTRLNEEKFSVRNGCTSKNHLSRAELQDTHTHTHTIPVALKNFPHLSTQLVCIQTSQTQKKFKEKKNLISLTVYFHTCCEPEEEEEKIRSHKNT